MNSISTAPRLELPSIQTDQPLTGRVAVLVWIFILSFAFDVKGVVGGTAAQYVMAGFNTFAFVLLGLNFRFVLPRRGYPAQVLYVWLAFLVVGSLGAWMSGVSADKYIRIIYPFVLFAEGFLLVWWLAREQRDLRVLVQAMAVSAGVSVIYTLWWGFHFTGDSLGTIRYQIVSPLAVFLLLLAAYDLIFARKRRLTAFLWICVIVTILAISVTRTYVLIIGGVVGLLMLAGICNAVAQCGRIPKRLVSLFAYTVLGVLLVSVYLVTVPEVASRWDSRVLGPHSSVTYWTRVATVVNEWDQLIAEPSTSVLGAGFGHGFVYSSDYAARILPYVGREVFIKPSWYAAEVMWMSIPFYGGFVLGLTAIVILLRGAQLAFSALLDLLRRHLWNTSHARPFWIGVAVYFAFLFEGLAGDPFVYRAAGLYFGLCLGLVASYRLCRRSNPVLAN